ncbi:endolytic transglycosylase MltG, partial [candidate division KSB1 bacterium]
NKKIRAGKFRLSKNLSNYSILLILCKGKPIDEKITIQEGLTSQKICSILKDTLEIDSTKFISLLTDKEFINELGIDADNLEGYLFPETYYFPCGISEKEIIKKMVGEFHKVFNDSLKKRARELNFSVHEIVTLASIIEGEAKIDDERNKISAVFHNRLKRRMRLQADPTIQYIIKDGPRRLLLKDLKIESPYNTYLHRGLPPGPICNPGKKSIIAALYPSCENYLYFVAKGDGSHIFSRTKKEHLKAKRNLDLLRRQLKFKRKK